MGPPPLDLLVLLIFIFAGILWAAKPSKRQQFQLVAVSNEPDEVAVPPETVSRIDNAMSFLRVLCPGGPWVLRKAGKVTVAGSEDDARAWLEKNLGK